MAVLGPCVSVNMNGHNNIHSQLTKSLERILEDAYLSGELKLSGRKLKEFPKPVKFDLSDTVIADLSKNRFNELPDEVTTYMYLEKLLLSQNIIRSVPDAVGGLQSLTYLDLSKNQLTELPREVCLMPLQVLLLSENMLSSLPKEIGKMTSLAELDASNNRLTQVPMTLGDCVGLRALDLSKNQLGLLPLQITYLRLEHLDVSCNCISSLPLELRNMSTIVTLNLDNNPLVSPPTTVCMRGRVHIFKYLENMANKDTLPHRRVDETRRAAKHSSFSNSPQQSAARDIVSGNATIDCLRHKPRHVVDSGYCTDGVEKRWSNDGGGDGGGSGRSTPSTPSTLSPGAALSRAHSLSSESPLAPPAPMTPLLSGFRISPEGMSNGDDKTKLLHQQTYRQYKEALRQQRAQDIYRPRSDQGSPDLDSPHSQNQSPVHQKSPHSPINGYSNVSPSLHRPDNPSNVSPSLYRPDNPSNVSPSLYRPNNSPSLVPNSPLLHSTPRRFQQNGNTEKTEENKRPVQKVVPSRNGNKIYAVNGNPDYNNRVESYIKPTSPTKSPTHIGYNSLAKEVRLNGDPRSNVAYAKGAVKPGKMPWSKEMDGDKLSFTMKREFDKQREETELLQQLRTIIESKLKMSLPVPLAPALADGVVLCHLANHVRARSVASVHVPSPAQPKLSMARCRRNVDNFLEACRKIGVEEEFVCSPEDILRHHGEWEGGSSPSMPLATTLSALLAIGSKDTADPCQTSDYASDVTADSCDNTFEHSYENGHRHSAANYDNKTSALELGYENHDDGRKRSNTNYDNNTSPSEFSNNDGYRNSATNFHDSNTTSSPQLSYNNGDRRSAANYNNSTFEESYNEHRNSATNYDSKTSSFESSYGSGLRPNATNFDNKTSSFEVSYDSGHQRSNTNNDTTSSSLELTYNNGYKSSTTKYENTISSFGVSYNHSRRSRYSEDRFVSNANDLSTYRQYTIDESEEYFYENNNTDQNGFVYCDGVRNRQYSHNNRVQFVTPFYKGERVLNGDNFIIYDTDEVDGQNRPVEDDLERYDRSKMNLQIENNLNKLTIETENSKSEENRLLFTCLCLGAFFLSAILLTFYPL